MNGSARLDQTEGELDRTRSEDVDKPEEVLAVETEVSVPVEEVEEVEEAIVPKKGYDLSFLDKLGDLEHASPTALLNNNQLLNTNQNGSYSLPIDFINYIFFFFF